MEKKSRAQLRAMSKEITSDLQSTRGPSHNDIVSPNQPLKIIMEPLSKKRKTAEAAEGILPKNTIYVNNLNDKIKIPVLRESLYMLFATYGEVLKVSMSPKQRGQAFVTFRTIDEANLALLSLRDEPFFSKPLHLQFSKHLTSAV